MKIYEILAALRNELRQLNETIFSLERINFPYGRGKLKKLGRPPGTKNKPKIVPLVVCD
jgi:hypothetical protein